MIAGKAAIVNGHKCIGHGLCAEACPVGAIEAAMGLAQQEGKKVSMSYRPPPLGKRDLGDISGMRA